MIDMETTQSNVQLGKNVFLAPTAYVGGDVALGDHCTVMYNVTIRGDVAPIRIGDRCNVQDGSILHTQYKVPLEIADEVAMGHGTVVHCRKVGRRSLIGSGAILLDGVEVGEDCIVAAGAVVTPGTKVTNGTLVAGIPARELRKVTEEEKDEIRRILEAYVQLGKKHAAGAFPNVVPIPE